MLAVFLALTHFLLFPPRMALSDTAETTESAQGARGGQRVPSEGGRGVRMDCRGVSERVLVMGGLTRRAPYLEEKLSW